MAKLDVDYNNQLVANPDFVEFFLGNVVEGMSFADLKRGLENILAVNPRTLQRLGVEFDDNVKVYGRKVCFDIDGVITF